MSKPKFEIGQTVYQADFSRKEYWVTCPDCLGSKKVLVILGDGTEVTIECGGCDPGGYEPSTGRVKQCSYEAGYETYKITGVTNSIRGTEYELDRYGDTIYYTGKEENLFVTKEEALLKADDLKAKFEQEENQKLMSKTKDERSWKWNATYHRKEIARLEKELAYHRRKVSVCEAKAREVVNKL